MSKLSISLTKPQADFIQLQNEALYCLFNGGYGCGKSHTLAVSAFLDALHSPNAIIGIFAPTFALVRDPNMLYVQKILDENGIEYDTNKNEATITTRSNQIGNFRFFSMDNPDTLIGFEIYTAHVDELDKLDTHKAEEVWNMILARTRQRPKDLPDCYQYTINGRREPRSKVCAYSTPEGYKFTYQTWGKNERENPDGSITYKDPEYRFVKAKTADNPFALQSYINNLYKQYSGQLAKAYLEGEWVNMTSGTVYYAYDIGHNNSEEEIKEKEDLHLGMDFNVGRMCAAVLVPRNGGSEWHQVAEVHGLLDVPDMIDYIQETWQSKGHRIHVYPDASGKNRAAQDANNASLTQLKGAGFHVVRNNEKNPFVKDRVSCMNTAFTQLKLFINAINCPNQADCLTQQPYNKMGKPDKTSGTDDPNDALGYFVNKKLNMRNVIQLLNFSFAQRT